MKKNKIIGVAVALLGTAITAGTSIALYTKAVNPVSASIGAGTAPISTEDVQFKLAGQASGATVNPVFLNSSSAALDGVSAINPEVRKIKYTISLGAQWANDVPAQNVVRGKLTVGFTSINSQLQSHATVDAQVKGFVEGTWGSHQSENVIFNNASMTTASLSENKELFFYTDHEGTHHNYLEIIITLDNSITGDAAVMSADELSNLYSLTVTLQEAATVDYDYAYITGSGTSWAVTEDALQDYRMHPNLGKEDVNSNPVFEWEYNNLVGSAEWTYCKAVKFVSGNLSHWSADPNTQLTDGQNYSLYWGGADNQIVYRSPDQ